jgi:CubicO group peptidase (beta-lactamase class C family)
MSFYEMCELEILDESAPKTPATALLEQVRLAHTSAAALAGIMARSCGIIMKGHIGDTFRGSGEPVSDAAAWHIGEITRSMTASLVAILSEDGHTQLSFDDYIGDHLDYAVGTPYEKVTIVQLLSDHGGLPTSTANITMFDTSHHRSMASKRTSFVAWMLTSLPPGGPIGAKLFSNLGYIVVAAVLEKVSRLPWEALMFSKLFGPLGMSSAGFGAPVAAGSPLGQISLDNIQRLPITALSYQQCSNKWYFDCFDADQTFCETLDTRGITCDSDASLIIDGVEPGKTLAHSYCQATCGVCPQQGLGCADQHPLLAPAAGCHASLNDLAKYFVWHLRGHRCLEVSPTLSEEGFLRLHQQVGDKIALGWTSEKRPWTGGASLHQIGSNTLWLANVWIAPQADMILFAVANEAYAGTDETPGTAEMLDDVVVGMLGQAEGICERAGASDSSPGDEKHCARITDSFGIPGCQWIDHDCRSFSVCESVTDGHENIVPPDTCAGLRSGGR